MYTYPPDDWCIVGGLCSLFAHALLPAAKACRRDGTCFMHVSSHVDPMPKVGGDREKGDGEGPPKASSRMHIHNQKAIQNKAWWTLLPLYTLTRTIVRVKVTGNWKMKKSTTEKTTPGSSDRMDVRTVSSRRLMMAAGGYWIQLSLPLVNAYF